VVRRYRVGVGVGAGHRCRRAGQRRALGYAAAQLKTLRAKDVAAILADLPRTQQAELTVLAQPGAAAEALAGLDPEDREALLADLDERDRIRLRMLLTGHGT
jgi:Mg/Co/Ni transporter MgtE